MSECIVDGCDKPSRGNGLCSMHYSRMRRHGHLEPTRPFNPTTGQCPVQGCEKPQNFDGMCKMHATRVRRHGDPFAVTHQRDRNLPRGPAHPKWTGDDATYAGVHQRLKVQKGRASDHPCADCGDVAVQWSYDHADPAGRMSELGAYSTNLDHYVPRCVPCHKNLDLSIKPIKARVLLDPQAITDMHGQGIRAAEIGRRLGVSGGRVNRAFDELGLPRFAPGSPGRARDRAGAA